MRTDSERLVLAAFIGNTVLAGGNAVAIRFSNRELKPLWGAGLRFALAAVLLCSLVFALRLGVPKGRALAGAAVWGLVQFAGAFGLAYYALVEIHAGLGQTLLALVPLTTLLLAVAQRIEPIRLSAVAGTLLGLAGVAFISRDLGQSVPGLSLLAVLGSVLCFAQAAVLVRRFPPVHPLTQNAIGMTVGSVVLIVLSALFGEPRVIPDRTETWMALAYVVVAGSVVVFLLYVFVLQNWTASRAAYTFVLIPFVTVVLSAWLDDEPVRIGLVIGGLLVLSGVYIGALRPARLSLREPEQPEPTAAGGTRSS